MVALLLVVFAAIAFAAPMQRGARGSAVQALPAQVAVQARPMQGRSAQMAQPARPAQQNMQQQRIHQEEVYANAPAELKAFIDAQRAEAAARQTANRADQIGGQMRQGGRSKGGRW